MSTPLQQHLRDYGAQCHVCPMGKGGLPGRPVSTEWRGAGRAPSLAIVGEAPGRREVQRGQPFCGPSGKLLALACQQAGILRGNLAILNAAACGPLPAGADEIKARTIKACRPRLLTELHTLRPKVILSLGGLAMHALAPKVSGGITTLRGALLDIGEDVPTPAWHPSYLVSLHPAHILRGGDAEAPDDAPGTDGSSSVDLLYYFLAYDLAKAWRLANDEVSPWRDDCDLFLVVDGRLNRGTVDAKGKPAIGEPAEPSDLVAAMARVVEEAKEQGAFACDTETDSKDALTAGLTACGFATKVGGMSATWEAWQSAPGALAIARQLLAGKLAKWFQNRIFDCLVLPRHGLPVAAPIEDTLILHHAAFPGLPHKLDAIAQQFLLCQPWKAEFRRSTRDDAELVIYNFRDAAATALIPAPLLTVAEHRKTLRVYEADRQAVAVAQHMRAFGFWVDRVEQARQSKIQHARLDYMRVSLGRDFAAIAPAWRERLARNLAVLQRKKDPDDFMERVTKRYREIAKREVKPTDVGLLKTKAKADLVALFEVLGIPFTGYTDKGTPSTDKKAMEAAAGKHPLMRQLIHIRGAQHVLATYIDGLPVKPTGRVHPDWSVTKISGRWSAGKSQNIPSQVAGWPPEKLPDGSFKRKPSGDYVTPIENPRALITAPTVEEILAHALDEPGVYQDARYRRIFERALEGRDRLLVGADQVQLELKIAALLGKIPYLLDAYAKGADVHAANARVCFPKVFPQIEADWAALAATTAYGDSKPLVPKANLAALDKLDDVTRVRLAKLAKPWKKLRDLAKRLAYAWEYRGRPEACYAALIRDFPELELSAVREAFKLLDEQMPEWAAWCNRNEISVRQNREVREALLGRVRLFPLGNYNINIAVNFPVQSFGASLIIFAMFRYCALVEPGLLDLGRLYKWQLLDEKWVADRRAEGFDRWHAPAPLLIHGHDSLTAECDSEDAPRLAVFLEKCMDFDITIDGATMHFCGEAAIGRRLSET